MDRTVEPGNRALRGWHAALLIAPLASLLLFLFLLPEAGMVLTSLRAPHWSLAEYLRFFSKPYYLGVLGRSLALAGVVTAASLAIGIPVAYWLARLGRNRAPALLLMMTFPLWISSIVRSFAWIVILGPTGLLSRLLQGTGLSERPTQLLHTNTGVIIALTHFMAPIALLSLYGTFRAVDPELELAAQSLGASPVRAALRVALPLAARGIRSTALLVFALSVAAFSTPSVVGGARIQLMSTTIYEQIIDIADWPFASAVACVLLVIGLFVAIAFTRLDGATAGSHR